MQTEQTIVDGLLSFTTERLMTDGRAVLCDVSGMFAVLTRACERCIELTRVPNGDVPMTFYGISLNVQPTAFHQHLSALLVEHTVRPSALQALAAAYKFIDSCSQRNIQRMSYTPYLAAVSLVFFRC